MPGTLAFDVYGTLIDTHGVVARLAGMISCDAEQFSRTWRAKQLEYSFRRALMERYENFAVCTSQALDFACGHHGVALGDRQKGELLAGYRALPAFADVDEGLARLATRGFRLYAFSNGSADAVEALLVAAGIRERFLGVVSTDDLKTFKPNPAVYRHFMKVSGASADSAWLISSNPFDVIGAISAGMRAAWVQRTRESVFDPWGIEPTITVGSLLELDDKLPPA